MIPVCIRLPRRIIPAHAGFTRTRARGPHCPPDHPRTRGVYPHVRGHHPSGQGSSPHTRGLRRRDPEGLLRGRIIPAHAGFTYGQHGDDCADEDHPRTRGVYGPPWPGVRDQAGSSPHTRGLPFAGLGEGIKDRIIPAHAGFTRVCACARRCVSDHPRTRGVYASPAGPLGPYPGSSPHTRGLRPGAWVRALPHGIIPAHAGFTPLTWAGIHEPRDHPRTRGVYG